MGLCLQLRMLLWKNFLLRKRQKFRLVVELLWPLFLFLILMWVRTKGLRENISECHFTPKALPSVGQVPFIQSFLCSFNNTCHATEKEAQIDGSNLQASRADSLVRELSTMFGQRLVDQDLDAAESVVADLNRLASLVQGITSRQVQVKGVLSVPELVNSTSWIKEEIFRQNISLDENAVDSLITAKFAPQNFSLGHLLLLQENRSLVLCDTQLMTSVIQVQSAVVDQLCRLSAVELDALANIMRESLTAAGTYQQLVQYVESNLDQSLSWSDWNSMRNLSVQVWQDFTSLQNYTKAMSDLAVMSSQYTYLADEMVANNVSRLEQAIVMFNYFLCGNQSGDLIKQLLNAGGKSTQWDDFRDQMRDSSVDEKQYVYDNTTTPVCNSYYELLDSSPPLRALWRMFKPFVRGKILYTPETVVTSRMMTKLNTAFEIYKDIYELTFTLSNVTLPNLKESLVNNTARLQVIKAILDSPASDILFNNTFLRTFLGTNYNETIMEFKKDLNLFLQPNNTQYREDTFDRFINITTDLNELFECFDWNKTVPYDNEDKAMDAGMALIEENKLWALLVFIDPGNDTLNPNTTYKIRMNVERVDNTEFIQDRLQRPGARIRPAVDLKYITFWVAISMLQLPVLKFVIAISRTFPLFMVLSWVYTCAMIVKSVVYEKEQRLKETMRVMGLGNGVHWLGWFVDSIVPMLVTIAMLTTVLVYGKVLKNADPTLVFSFLTIYGISVITQAFLISTFFLKSQLVCCLWWHHILCVISPVQFLGPLDPTDEHPHKEFTGKIKLSFTQ
ncbi:ATP-binding cassette sub-family A member 7-like [Homalodisca vitripennis]|uniref:ATP-binding cassette sub-family A member 7-like n=1 Tax=Homalodisca vitripennis TaxID=197043 RepID=UPI001EEC2EA0|nr:ATP-binding cassette sub-family A member 7-like [Homalodisca vitripennis]